MSRYSTPSHGILFALLILLIRFLHTTGDVEQKKSPQKRRASPTNDGVPSGSPKRSKESDQAVDIDEHQRKTTSSSSRTVETGFVKIVLIFVSNIIVLHEIIYSIFFDMDFNHFDCYDCDCTYVSKGTSYYSYAAYILLT